MNLQLAQDIVALHAAHLQTGTPPAWADCVRPEDGAHREQAAAVLAACRSMGFVEDDAQLLARAHPTRLHLHYILSQPADAAAWLAGDGGAATRSVGQVGGALVADKVPPHAAGRFALLCGPPGFLTQACDPALEALGYTKDARVYF